MHLDLRRSLRRAFRKTGFRRQIAPSFVDVMLNQSVDVVLDIGANDGDYGREIRDEGYCGRIVSFEPNPHAYARLCTAIANDPLWEAHQLGAGDVTGELTLSISKVDVFSSFKRLNAFGARTTLATEAESATVQVVRLDDYLAMHPDLLSRTYLKIDTQGYEMEVLRGTGGMLQKMAAVQAELGFVKTYENEEDWLNVVLWMRDRGFEIGTAVCNSAIANAAQVREFDFVFVQRPRDGLPKSLEA